MFQRWFAVAAALAAVAGITSSAQAAVMQVTYTGTVHASNDVLDLFGGGNLAGDSFTATLIYDTGTGSYSVIPGGQAQDIGPTITGSITINGDAFNLNSLPANNIVEAVERNPPTNDFYTTGETASSIIYNFDVYGTGIPFSLTTPFSATDNGTNPALYTVFEGAATGEFLTFANQTVMVSAAPTNVPEPLTITLFAAGLGGVTVLRRRRAKA